MSTEDLQEIIQGRDITLDVYLTQEIDGVETPFDLTSNTEITACFVGTSSNQTVTRVAGSEITVIGGDTLGHINIVLSDTVTNAMKEGKQPFEVSVDISTTKTIFQLLKKINVLEKKCLS